MASPTVTDVHALVDSVVSQARGEAITTVDLSTAMSVAQLTFRSNANQTVAALVQRIGQTIYSARPYARKFRGLLVDNQTWGNITQKTTPLPMATVEDLGLPSKMSNGTTVDMYKINKRESVSLFFYDQRSYDFSETLFRDQLRTAFTSPAEFERYLSALATRRANDVEQSKEEMARMTLSNFIGGIVAENKPARVVKVLSEYNAATGLSLDAKTIYQPANFAPFMRWLWGRVQTLSDMLTEQTGLYHTNLNGYKDIIRHTPITSQRMYMLSGMLNNVSTSVMSQTFHDDYLKKFKDVEPVNYWQSPASPEKINIKATYLLPTGETKTVAVEKSTVLGVLMDEEAAGYTIFDEFMGTTPINTRGRFWNLDQHHQARYWNDFSENGVVFLME